jgi:hypothetical protein
MTGYRLKILAGLAIFIAMQISCLVSLGAADSFNPQPADGDYILPMPNGAAMVFRPVFIGKGSQPFAYREFKVGDRSGGGFKEYPTNVVIGGSFIGTDARGQTDWLYYMGKYEVTEAQYIAVMKPGSKTDSQLPVTNVSWYDVQSFIEKYNLWLFEHVPDRLPKNEDALGFVTLPTEIEWEFAARGATAVDATRFDKKHPYTGPLAKYEWYAGPSSSHGKIKPVGQLAPNPLSIYDMLGNVSEMTASLYQIEYYQGRTGGFVARGGTSFEKESKIRSSLRNEIPFFNTIGGKTIATRQPILGFRLGLSSPIYAGRDTSRKLAEAWADYRQTRPAPAAPAVAALPTASRTNVQLTDARNSLRRLQAEIGSNPRVSQAAKDQLGILQATFGNIESTVQKAEKDSAYAWVKIVSEKLFTILSRDLAELEGKRRAFEAAQQIKHTALVESIGSQIDQKQKNIAQGLESYAFTLQQLENIRPEIVRASFDDYKAFLISQGASIQLMFTEEIVIKHYENYMQNRRFDVDLWKNDLEKFAPKLQS